jgi:hypothetical protein
VGKGGEGIPSTGHGPCTGLEGERPGSGQGTTVSSVLDCWAGVERRGQQVDMDRVSLKSPNRLGLGMMFFLVWVKVHGLQLAWQLGCPETWV